MRRIPAAAQGHGPAEHFPARTVIDSEWQPDGSGPKLKRHSVTREEHVPELPMARQDFVRRSSALTRIRRPSAIQTSSSKEIKSWSSPRMSI